MKYKVYWGLVFRIILIFSIGMLWTFINPHLREFLGDTYCGSGNCDGTSFRFDDQWIWGARHYWYWWMMFLLFILSLTNVVMSSINLVNRHYPK